MSVIPLKYIVLTEVYLSIWAVFSEYLGATYLFSNLALFAGGMWCVIDKNTTDGFTVYAVTYLWALLTDLFVLGKKTKDIDISNMDSDMKFSFAMALINIFVKVAALYPLWQEYNNRGSQQHPEGQQQPPQSHGHYDPNTTVGVSGIAPTVGGPSSSAQSGFMGAQQQQQQPPMGGVVGSGGVAASSGFQQGGYNT